MPETFHLPAGCVARVIHPAKQDPTIADETPEQRLMRLYASEGGPLIGWLLDESRRRGQSLVEMAAELKVTYGYIHQLRSGLRRTSHLSQEVINSCSRYLGVPPVVVKVVSGALPVSDFVWPTQSEQEAVDRALNAMKGDPIARTFMPTDLSMMPAEAKRALVLMYAESSGQDVFGVRRLPDVLQWLQRAAIVHDDNFTRASA